MKKILVVAAIAALAFAGYSYASADKVAICHVTGSAGNPFEVITVADAAYDSHIAHGDTDVNDDGTCGDNGGGGDPGET